MTPLRSFAVLVLGCLLAVNVEASLSFDNPPANLAHLSSHRRLMHRRASADGASLAKVRRSAKDSKRCKVRDATAAPEATSTSWTSSSSTVWSTSISSWSSSSTWTPEATSWSSSSSAPQPTHKAKGGVSNANAANGLINVQSNCGDIGATKDVTPISGPNGNINWLNCGLNNGGWNPPNVKIGDLVAVDLSTAIQSGSSPFTACSDFIYLFNQYGGQYGIPPIMLAAFAMQESSCNPNTVGGAGEQGLMQLTKDKCGDAPGGNCKDPDYNIRTGAKYFSDSLASNNGNVLLTIGRYNGWSKGLTYGSAVAAAYTSCCRCQQNLDYLHQFVNGWLQNVDAYTVSPPLGLYFNLNQCN